jgi:hypothetical protein
MADRVETFAVSCTGGLVTNQPTLAQAAQMPGTARELVNFEPSVEGGYRRINGYTKWTPDPAPIIPTAYADGASSGTTIKVGNIEEYVFVQMGAYTITAQFGIGGPTRTVSNYVSAGGPKNRTGTIDVSFSISVADKTPIFFSTSPVGYFGLTVPQNAQIQLTAFPGLFGSSTNTVYFLGPNGATSRNQGSKWEAVNMMNGLHLYSPTGLLPPHGKFYSRVDGAGQTGTTLNIKDVKYAPRLGDTFIISGVAGVYTVDTGTYTLSNNTCTINIYPTLASSPSNNARVEWLSYSFDQDGQALATTQFSIGQQDYAAVAGKPCYIVSRYSGCYEMVSELNTKIEALNETQVFTNSVAYFKNHMFWGHPTRLFFSAPFNVFDYSPAAGAGEISIGDTIVGLLSLRDSLIIFCRKSVHRLTGSSVDTFSLSPITENTGCVDGATIQEINGDVLFLSDNGFVRLLDTDQQSGLGLGVVSNTISAEATAFLNIGVAPQRYYSSVFFPNKQQYRVFRIGDSGSPSTGTSAPTGVIAAQVSANPAEISWSLTSRLFVYSNFLDRFKNECVFIQYPTQSTYVYQMDSGNTFDGTNITATYSTPYYHMNDPRVRKAFLNLETTVEPEGAVTLTVDTLLNYNKSDVIQPPAVVVGTTGTTYGDNTSPSYVTTLIGNGDVVSLKFTSNTNIPPYVIQSFTIEYSTNDRR